MSVYKIWELTKNTKVKYGITLTQIKRAGSDELGGWIDPEKATLGKKCWIGLQVEFYRGEIWGGVIMGGEIWGGEIWGGEIRGGVIRGGEIWGGVIRGGEIRGGVIRGGVIRGGVIWGGEIWGGVIRGGEIWGGVIRGGEIWGGVIRGGEIRGGEIWGGVIMGGVISGGAKIETSEDILEISPIGSEDGVFTAFKCEVGFKISRGCFTGTPLEFKAAVRKTHGRTKHGEMYMHILQLCEMKFGKKFWDIPNG